MANTLSPGITIGPHGSARPARSFPTQLWDMLACFRSVHLAIVLLTLLAAGVFAGVMIPQDGLVETADIKAQFGSNYRMFKAMGLFNVYSSYWFITLEALFFFNLLFGSFQWLKPAFLAATRREFCGPEHIRVSPNHFWVKTSPEQGAGAGEVCDAIRQVLAKRFYGVHISTKSGPWKLYAAKGNFSRLGPVVAHFGILCLLVASVYGAFTGFTAQKLAVPGETFGFDEVDRMMPRMEPALWQGTIPDWQVSVKEFRVDFYENVPTTAKQYYADIVLQNTEGEALAEKQIAVNHPLSYGDLTIYQASFAPTGKLMMTVDGVPETVEVNTNFQDRPVSLTEVGNPDDQLAMIVFPFFVQQDPGVTRNHVRVFLHQGDAFKGATPGKMPPNLKLFPGETGVLNGMEIGFVKPELATGLQIKKSPETLWIYAAFAIICIGTVMCFFSQRQIWVALEPGPDGEPHTVYVHWKTNKARLSFNKELDGLKCELYEAVTRRRLQT